MKPGSYILYRGFLDGVTLDTRLTEATKNWKPYYTVPSTTYD